MSQHDGTYSPDSVVDELLPGDFDWKRLVCAYPIPALSVALVGGFLIGREHGPKLVAALSSFAVDEVTRKAQALLGAAPDDD